MWSDISQFHFLRPEWFFALIPLAISIAWLRFEKTAQGDWHQLIPEHLLKHLIHEQRGSSSKHAITLLALLWSLCVFALAGPTWQKISQPVYEKIEARVYVLDLSYSMYAADLKPNRISRARLKLLDLLEKNREGYSALVVFSGDAHVVTPLTNDTNTIGSLVPSLEPDIMPNIGSSVSDGVQKALELLYNTKIEKGKIILLTDEVTDKEATRINALMDQSKFSLSILGIGTKEGAPIKLPNGQFLKDNSGSVVIPKLDSSSLKQLASLHDGVYISIQPNDRDIHYLERESISDDDAREGTQQYDIWFEFGQWIMLPIVLLAALSFRRGWILGLLFCMGISQNPNTAYAAENTTANATPQQQIQQPVNKNEKTEKSGLENIQDQVASWFKTGDQRGLAKFKQQKFSEAAELFNNKDWKASSLYYSGQFAEASDNFKINEKDTLEKQASSWYNKGNALAFARDYDGAIKAYDKSLALKPDNEDAAFNRELVEKAKELEKQEQQEQDNEQNSEQQQDSQPDSSQQQSSQDQNDKQNSDNSKSQDQQNSNQDSQNQESNDENSQEDTSSEKQSDKQEADNQDDQQDQQDQQQDEESDEENTQGENASEENSEEKSSEEQMAEQAEDSEEDALSSLSPEEREKQQALEQWLRQIPDDPSGLMRRKFSLESKRNPQKRSDKQQVW